MSGTAGPTRSEQLPTGFPEAGNLPGQCELAKHDARDFELAEIAAASAGDLAAQARAGWARVARQLGDGRVIFRFLELAADVGVFFHQTFAALLFCYPCLGCHKLPVLL